jgi:hypothetical protein
MIDGFQVDLDIMVTRSPSAFAEASADAPLRFVFRMVPRRRLELP